MAAGGLFGQRREGRTFFLLRLLEELCLLFYSSVENDYQYLEPQSLIIQRRSFLVPIVLQLRVIGGIQVPISMWISMSLWR